jgi:Uma2 family endonuclease
MSSAPRYIPHYTVEDYRHWRGDWELWSGTAVAMTPSPFGRHGGMLARLVTALTNGIDSAGCKASVLAEVDWIISEATVVRPDASVVCGEPPEGHIESAPAIVVEVLSAATRERDLNQKRVLYENHGVPWYLIADPDNASISILRLSDQRAYVAVAVEEVAELAICGDCRLTIDLRRCLRRERP